MRRFAGKQHAVVRLQRKNRQGQRRRGNQEFVSGLLDVRHHLARPAGCARRPQAFATPHSVRDARPLAVPEPPAPQMREDLRRHQRQLPSARRSGHLSDARPHGAAVGDARTARGRPGQLRLRRRRPARRHALHRGAHDAPRRRAHGGHGPGHGGFRPELRRDPHRADGFPAAFPNLLVNGGTGIAVGMATNIRRTTSARSSTASARRSTTRTSPSRD